MLYKFSIILAIYELKDLCSIKKGKGKFYKRHLNVDGVINGFHYGQLYKYDVMSSWKIKVSEDFSQVNNYCFPEDILLIDVSESFDEIGHVVYNQYEKGLIGNHIIHLHGFKNCNSKWLYYYLKSNQKLFRQLSYGDKVASLKISDLEHLLVQNMPTLEQQKEIIEIIKPIENMILRLERIKNEVNVIISSLKIEKTNISLGLETISTGKRNANHEVKDGKYNFYTCGSNVKKCNDYSFDGKYILLSGNANLYTWWYEGKFDLYQRVYALKPIDNFFTTYHSVREAMKELRDVSSGSVIKYIKLSDIQNIKMVDTKFEYVLSKLYNFESKIDNLIGELTKILDKSIKKMIK